MTPDKLQRIQELSNELASLLYDEVHPEELTTLKDIESNVRDLSLRYVLPNFGVFLSKPGLTQLQVEPEQ
jgi:hypothetical protein